MANVGSILCEFFTAEGIVDAKRNRVKWASRLAIQAFSKQEIPSQNKNSHHFVSQN